MESPTRSRVITGAMLIVLGLGLFGMNYFEQTGRSVVLLLLGEVFVATYLYTRGYLLLVAGCILVGLGIGSFGETSYLIVGDFTHLGLGIGFVLIYLIALLYE